jgi:hypothetical protein
MPRDDLTVVAHEHGIGEAEAADGVCDLADLLLGVLARIAGVVVTVRWLRSVGPISSLAFSLKSGPP